MMIKKTLTILAASCMMYSLYYKNRKVILFFTEFQTEYGVPSFDKIKLEHYEPAFLKGIEEQNQNIEAIIESPEVPTFENTIVALDNSAPIFRPCQCYLFQYDRRRNDRFADRVVYQTGSGSFGTRR